MAYTTYYGSGFADGSGGGTPITAASLNHMETGISDAADTADAAIPTPGTKPTNSVLYYTGSAYASQLLVNANVDAAAAIAYSKLNLAGEIVNNDIDAAAAIAYSKLSLGGSIVNADISGSAAIGVSKLGSGTPAADKYLDGGGTWTTLPVVLLDRASGAVDNDNSASETDIYTYTIPANTVAVGDSIHLVLLGRTARVAEILTLRLYLGGTVLDTLTFNAALTDNDLYLDAWIGHWDTATQTAAGKGQIAQTSYNVYGTSTIDMTSNQILKVTAQSNSAVSGSYLRRQQALVNLHKGT